MLFLGREAIRRDFRPPDAPSSAHNPTAANKQQVQVKKEDVRVHGITDKMKKLTKQEACMISHFLTIIAAFVLLSFPARAESLYFISLAHIAEGKEAQYSEFTDKIGPVWKRHGITVLLRTHVLSALISPEDSLTLDEISVLRINDREGFNAYLADPAYKRLNQTRLDALDRMVVLEATEVTSASAPSPQTTPLFVFVFHRETVTRSPVFSAQELSVTARGPVKGQMDLPIHHSKQVTIIGLSYDDNPLSFLDDLPEQSEAFIAQRIEQ